MVSGFYGRLALLLCLALFCGLTRAQNAGDLNQMFDALDRNKDGVVDWNEFKMVFLIADRNGDGVLDGSEYPAQAIAAITGGGSTMNLDQFKVTFDTLDANKDGVLSRAEFTNPQANQPAAQGAQTPAQGGRKLL